METCPTRTGRDEDGLVQHNLALTAEDRKRIRPVAPADADENERFLSAENVARNLVVLNEYGRRRAAGIAALNHASLVTPPSEYLRRVLVAFGVEERRTRVVRLGQPHFDQIHRRARESPFYHARPWDTRNPTRPLRLAFLGTTRPSKGIEVLAEAIPLIPPTLRRRCQFHLRVQGYDQHLRKRLSAYPEVSFLGGYDLVQLIAAAGEYDVGLLPHAWFENSPLVMLEHLHAGKFVIASRLGGPPEWIIEPSTSGPGNGVLVPGGRPAELAAAIASIASGDVVLPSPAEVHAATPNLQTYPGHVAEVSGLYTGLALR